VSQLSTSRLDTGFKADLPIPALLIVRPVKPHENPPKSATGVAFHPAEDTLADEIAWYRQNGRLTVNWISRKPTTKPSVPQALSQDVAERGQNFAPGFGALRTQGNERAPSVATTSRSQPFPNVAVRSADIGRGVIVNRESEIRRCEETDIHIDAVTQRFDGRNDRLTLVGEPWGWQQFSAGQLWKKRPPKKTRNRHQFLRSREIGGRRSEVGCWMSNVGIRISHFIVAVVHSISEINPASATHPFTPDNSNFLEENEGELASRLAGRRRNVGIVCLQFGPERYGIGAPLCHLLLFAHLPFHEGRYNERA
jgi:hypothetical protein